MKEKIGVDPDTVLGLQADVTQKLRNALKKQDRNFVEALKTFLVMSPSKRNEVCGIKFSNELIFIIERPDLKTSDIMKMMREKFEVSSYYNDKMLDKEFPAPKEATTRNFRKGQEPDKETLGLSTQQAEEKGYTNGITLRERMLLEIDYFNETGKHLGIKGITFCSGSRDSDNRVPLMHWYNSRVQVDWCYPEFSRSVGGIRSAVS